MNQCKFKNDKNGKRCSKERFKYKNGVIHSSYCESHKGYALMKDKKRALKSAPELPSISIEEINLLIEQKTLEIEKRYESLTSSRSFITFERYREIIEERNKYKRELEEYKKYQDEKAPSI